MVEYLSGGRIQGSSTLAVTPTVNDNLSSDLGWNSNTSDWAYDGTNDRLDLDPVRRNTTAQRLYIDLQDADYLNGSNLSDTAWVARWAVYSGAQNSSGNVPLHMTFSNNLDDSGSTQQSASVNLNMSPSENTTGFQLSATTGNFENSSSPTRISSTVYSQSDGLSTNTTYYIELIRNSNSWTCNVFSSSAYSGTALGTATISKSGLSSLRYMKMINDSEQSGTKTKTGTWIDDIKIYNGITDASDTDEKTTLTNIPAGTRYEETDTRKIYRRTAGSTALSGFNPEDFSSDNWTEGSCTSISGAKLIASNGHHLGNNIGNGFFTGYKAIGQTLSTNWVLRFKWKTTDMNSNSGNYDGDRVLVGVCEDSYYDNVGDGSVSAKNVIGIALFGSDSAPRFIGYANSGGAGVGWTATPNVNLTTTPATNQIRYFEIIKDGTTVYFNDFGTDNTYTTRVAQNSLTGNSFSNLDTFIVSGFTGNGASQPDVAGELDDVYIYDDTVSVDPEWKERGNA